MLKISIIFCLEIHFMNINLAPDCTCNVANGTSFYQGLRPQGGGGGGGGTQIFSAYVGSDPASTVHPQKISGISSRETGAG